MSRGWYERGNRQSGSEGNSRADEASHELGSSIRSIRTFMRGCMRPMTETRPRDVESGPSRWLGSSSPRGSGKGAAPSANEVCLSTNFSPPLLLPSSSNSSTAAMLAAMLAAARSSAASRALLACEWLSACGSNQAGDQGSKVNEPRGQGQEGILQGPERNTLGKVVRMGRQIEARVMLRCELLSRLLRGLSLDPRTLLFHPLRRILGRRLLGLRLGLRRLGVRQHDPRAPRFLLSGQLLLVVLRWRAPRPCGREVTNEAEPGADLWWRESGNRAPPRSDGPSGGLES